MKQEWQSTNLLHTPVLKDQVIQLLNIHSDGIYIDGTIGLGGHAAAILAKLSPTGTLLGFDGDEEAIKHCQTSFDASSRLHLFNDCYDQFPLYLKSLNLEKVDGMLLDLGLSSLQLDSPSRGFSYRFEGPLDMRFNRSDFITAKEILNSWKKRDIIKIFRDFGEDFKSAKIAEKIVKHRLNTPLQTTSDLKNIIRSVVGGKNLTKSSSRIFQSLRIAVNNELRSLENFLNHFADYLKVGGKVVIISYHSLEDRLVKNKFKELQKGCTCSPEIPICQCGKKPSLKIISKSPITPSQKEIIENSRARSAKLRVAEKI